MPAFDHDEPTAIRRAQRGLSDACGRVSHYISEGEVDLMYIAYVEAVMWVRGLDERFRRLDPSYTGRRDGHPQGQAVAGLCWVRDKGIHQLVTFHTKAERSENDLGLGPNFPDGDVAMWLPSSDVVEREPPRPSDTPKKAAYDRHLVGRPLWTVLADARNFLWMDAAALLAK